MGKTLDNNDLNQIVESGGAKREKNRKKKTMVALLVFVLAILETFFNEEKTA